MFDDYTMQVWEIQAVKDDKREDLDDHNYCNCFGAARRCFNTILKDCRGFVDSYWGNNKTGVSGKKRQHDDEGRVWMKCP